MKIKGLVALTLASFGFGAGSAVQKMLMRDFPGVIPIDLVQTRLLFAGLCLLMLGIIRKKGVPRLAVRDIKHFAILGILGIFVVQFFLMYAVSRVYVGVATFTQATATLMLCVYSVLVLKERMTRGKLIALFLGFGGLIFVLQPSQIFGGQDLFDLGVLAALISAVGKCFYILYGRLLQQKHDSMIMIGAAMLSAAVFALLFARPWRIIAQYGGDHTLILYLVVYIFLCTAVPFALYFEGLRQVPVTVAGITNIIEPVGGAIMAFFLTGEKLGLFQFIGIAAILFGVFLVQCETLRTNK